MKSLAYLVTLTFGISLYLLVVERSMGDLADWIDLIAVVAIGLVSFSIAERFGKSIDN